MKAGFDFVLNQKLVRDILGNDRNEFKQRVVYMLNISFMLAVNFYQMAFAFISNLLVYFYNTYIAGEKVLKKDIVLITGSGGYLGIYNKLNFSVNILHINK
jgi:hypothetical protein